MTDWLRPKFQRTPSSFLDENPNDHDKSDRARASSRVSSYLGLTSTRAPSPSPSSSATESFLVKSPSTVYERPSVDQMVESLKVAMMIKSSMDPLPIEHNSSIFHLLEAYQDVRTRLDTKDQIIHEMQERHTQAVHDYEAKLAQWEAKEEDYMSEMKKLEVLLANTEGGLEKVTIARTNSVLGGALRRKSKIEVSKNPAQSRRATSPHHQNPVIRVLPRKRAPTLRSTFDVESWRQEQLAHSKNVKALSQTIDHGVAVDPNLRHAQEDTLDEPHIEKDLGMEFESSESSPSLSTASGQSVIDKPLPAIPRIETKESLNPDDTITTCTSLDSSRVKGSRADQVRPPSQNFSYRPGDDDQEMFFTGETARAHKKRTALIEQQRQRVHAKSFPPLKGDEKPKDNGQNAAKKADLAGLPNPQSVQSKHSSSKESKHEALQADRLTRCDSSTSSVVTAVRDNSGRSSGSTEGSNGRPGLNRGPGSDTATIAARRAIASRNSRSESSDSSQTRRSNFTTALKDDSDGKNYGKQKGASDPQHTSNPNNT